MKGAAGFTQGGRESRHNSEPPEPLPADDGEVLISEIAALFPADAGMAPALVQQLRCPFGEPAESLALVMPAGRQHELPNVPVSGGRQPKCLPGRS